MEDLRKVSSQQLYTFWKNFSVGLLSFVVIMILSMVLPFYFSPVVTLIVAAYLYTILYNNKLKAQSSCMIVPYAVFFCLISYSFLSIVLNILHIWEIIWLPKEMTFFVKPYVSALILDPTCVVALTFIYFRRHKLSMCIDCMLQRGRSSERGKLGLILDHESRLQLRNLIWIFLFLSVSVWVYYFIFYYHESEINSRDWYVFVWLNIIALVLDELFFSLRYYNLYLDLKENDEIITPEELHDLSAKTYLRFYVICGNKIYINEKSYDPRTPYKEVIDTPFITKRSVSGISVTEVETIIKRMTGYDGKLRFFYGRKSPDLERHSLLRYFYFLDGNIEDYPDIRVSGEWMDFDELKKIYSFRPGKMSPTCVSDITRMATIILTQKTFNENGFRKNKLASYRPTFDLKEVEANDYDFQDDKWIKISLFNSDTKLYRLKRWWRNRRGGKNNRAQWS